MKKTICLALSLILTIALLLSGCSLDFEKNELTVAIFPYVPDVQLFEDILVRQWKDVHPDVQLNFAHWDCFADSPPVDVDVIMFDTMYTEQILQDEYIQPISKEDIEDIEGILPFAVEGALSGDQCYGIPFLVCSDFLIYYKDDVDVAEAENFYDLCAVIDAQMAGDPNCGLSTNYYINYPYYFLDALMDHSGEYTTYPEIPEFDSTVLQQFQYIQSLLSPTPESEKAYELGTFYHPYLFNQGIGRVHYGYSEDMSLMDDIIDELGIRCISFSEKENIQLFAADLVSMTAQVTDPVKKSYCVDLMNLIGSKEFQQELCFGSEEVQYMLPARQELYSIAAKSYPMYKKLEKLVSAEENKLLLFGPDVFEYQLKAMEIFE